MSYRRTTLNTHAATCAVLTSIILREYLITGDWHHSPTFSVFTQTGAVSFSKSSRIKSCNYELSWIYAQKNNLSGCSSTILFDRVVHKIPEHLPITGSELITKTDQAWCFSRMSPITRIRAVKMKATRIRKTNMSRTKIQKSPIGWCWSLCGRDKNDGLLQASRPQHVYKLAHTLSHLTDRCVAVRHPPGLVSIHIQKFIIK